MNAPSDYEKLRDALPEIAEAVKAFESPDLQMAAFNALLAAAGLGGSEASSQVKASPKQKKTNASKRPRKASRRQPKIAKDLVLAPDGIKSFSDFAAEKQPKAFSNQRATVAVYYLQHFLERTNIGIDEIYTCFRDQKWKLPADFENMLQKTSQDRGWLDTSSMSNIRVTPQGVNFVEQELTAATKK